MEEPKVNVIGQMDNTVDHTHESANRVYDTAGCSPSLTTCGGGNLEPKILEEPKVCAMRGRNPEKPTSRQPGLPLEQMIEVAENGEISNTITSVYKDNMLLENTSEEPIKVRQATEKGYIECEPGGIADLSFPDSENRRARVQDGGRVSPALTCAGIAGLTRLESRYRIRKLTERECWRLMGFTDEEFDKAASVNSKSQLYKQAGNSIVVDVLVALFTEVVGSIGTVNTHSGEQINLFDLLD